jgi:hypothetical protein
LEPAGTDVGIIEVITRAAGAGVWEVPLLEAAGLELPQPETKAAAERHTTAETKAEDKQYFMVESKYTHEGFTLTDGFQRIFGRKRTASMTSQRWS